MKKINFLVRMVTAMLLLCGMSAYAQTDLTANSQASLISAVNALKTSGGGTITLTPPFTNASISVSAGYTIDPSTTLLLGSSVDLESDSNNKITIECGTNNITVYGVGSSGAHGNLIIGNGITVQGHGTSTIDNNSDPTKGAIEVANGGTVINTCPSGGTAINAGAGRSIIDPGAKVIVNSPLGIGVNAHNSYTTVITGGTISATGTGTIALEINGTPGTNTNIIGATIMTNGANSIAIYATGGWSVILNNVTISTDSPTGTTDKAIVADAGSGILIPKGDGTVIYSAIPYSGDGSIIDLQSTITITPSVVPGPVTLPQTVTFSATCVNPNVNDGAAVAVAAPIVASFVPTDCEGTPSVSTLIPNNSLTLTTTNLVAYAALGLAGTSNPSGMTNQFVPNPPATFTYSNGTGIPDVSVDKPAAYIYSNVLYTPAGNVQLFGVGGQVILNTVADGAGIDVSALAKGVYIVKVGTSAYKVVK